MTTTPMEKRHMLPRDGLIFAWLLDVAALNIEVTDDGEYRRLFHEMLDACFMEAVLFLVNPGSVRWRHFDPSYLWDLSASDHSWAAGHAVARSPPR